MHPINVRGLRDPNAPKPKIKQFTYRRRYSFSGGGVLDGSNPRLIIAIRAIPRHTDLSPKQMQVWFGVDDEPTDESIEYYLDAVDPDNIPAQDALRNSSAWIAAQNWESIGVVAQLIQTLTRDELEFPKVPIYSNRTTGTKNYVLALLAVSDASSNPKFSGSIELEITIDRRIWPGPDWPTDMEFEDWEG